MSEGLLELGILCSYLILLDSRPSYSDFAQLVRIWHNTRKLKVSLKTLQETWKLYALIL